MGNARPPPEPRRNSRPPAGKGARPAPAGSARRPPQRGQSAPAPWRGGWNERHRLRTGAAPVVGRGGRRTGDCRPGGRGGAPSSDLTRKKKKKKKRVPSAALAVTAAYPRALWRCNGRSCRSRCPSPRPPQPRAQPPLSPPGACLPLLPSAGVRIAALAHGGHRLPHRPRAHGDASHRGLVPIYNCATQARAGATPPIETALPAGSSPPPAGSSRPPAP